MRGERGTSEIMLFSLDEQGWTTSGSGSSMMLMILLRMVMPIRIRVRLLGSRK
jgi:hypothetical protein